MAKSRKLFGFVFLLVSLAQACAQYELPNEIFERTLLIRSDKVMATAFKFDVSGRIYLVTTRRLASQLPLKNAIVQVWRSDKWNDLQTKRTFFPTNQAVDLAVLETTESRAIPYRVVKSSEVLTTDQKVWFMGSWPPHPKLPTLPGTLKPPPPIVPFVGVGSISAIDPTKPDSFEIEARRFCCNELTAPGPIIYWSPVHKDFEVLGVLKRIESTSEHSKSADTLAPRPKFYTLRGYSIDIVTDTVTGSAQ
jgi:hypothetical protein